MTPAWGVQKRLGLCCTVKNKYTEKEAEEMQEEKVTFSLLQPLSPTPQGLLTVCTNFKTTNIRVQRKSFLQLAIRASWSWHLLAQTSFQLAPKTFWLAELISQFFGYLNSSKNITCPSHKLKTECTRPIAKSTSPGYRTLLSLQTEYTLKPWILNQFGLSQRAGRCMGISLSFHKHITILVLSFFHGNEQKKK